MERIGLTLPTNHQDLITGLKKAGILSPAIKEVSPFDLNRHLNLNGYALRLRKDGKAYTLAKWQGRDLRQTLEQYVLQGSNIHVTIKA